DGALYFTIGGRQTQSGLYRVTYMGKEPTGPVKDAHPLSDLARAQRYRLETFHGKTDPSAVETAWPYLDHSDRFVRFAARVAIEHQDHQTWQERALSEKEPGKALAALLALVRAVGQDPFHHPRKPGDPIPGEVLKSPILSALDRMAWESLN